jgi:O-antigen ligase
MTLSEVEWVKAPEHVEGLSNGPPHRSGLRRRQHTAFQILTAPALSSPHVCHHPFGCGINCAKNMRADFRENQPLSSPSGFSETVPLPLHPLEQVLLAVVTAHLIFLPWALGTMHVWSQAVSCGLSVLSLGLALSIRRYSGKYVSGPSFRLRLLPKLLYFPIFWIGLMFLLYILIQALNPAWRYTETDRGWWLQGVSHIAWLPTGIRTPFEQFGPWRSLMIYSSAWMSACAIWTGFTRRKSLRILLVLLVINAFLLALFGLAERALHADRIFWSWIPPADYFVSSFIYRNHAGAYFNLALAICCALGFWYYRRQVRRQEPSSPAVILGFFAAVIAAIVLYSYSRGATLLMIGFLATVVGMIAGTAFSSAESNRSLFTIVFAGMVFVAIVGLSLFSLKTDQLTERMRTLSQEVDVRSDQFRLAVDQATWEMAQDHLAMGWGAGSYSYCFPGYQARHPEIRFARDRHKRLLFEHAHDDYLELLAECGCVGCALLMAGILFYLSRLVRLRVWRNPLVSVLFLGCLVTMVHATFDFPFFNPAILITWCCLWPVMLRWLEIENQRGPA